MPKVVACIIARTVSQRLPLKVLRDLRSHVSMLDFMIQSVKAQKSIDEVYLCTSTENVDDIMEDLAARNGIKCYRGSADEVIQRMLAVGEIENADILIRITGDNPFTAAELIGEQVNFLIEENLDYVRVTDLPIGATAEVFTFNALKKCNTLMDPKVSEYLMLYMFEPENFRCGVIKAYDFDYSYYSLTVDNPDDLVRTRMILSHFSDKEIGEIRFSEVLDVIRNENNEMPAKIITPGGTVKLPFDKVITYDEFQRDMQRRKDNSKFRKLYE